MRIINTHVHGLRVLAAATIQERRLFRSELPIVRQLFKGDV